MVTGATGAVGPALCGLLLERGYRVRAVSRTPPRPGILPDAVGWRAGDVTDPTAMRAACAGADLVFHLAARLHRPAGGADPAWRRVNLEGTAVTLAAARGAGTGRVVVCSTISVYGDTRGAVADEDSLIAPETEYASTKAEAEAVALAAARADGAPLAVVLRLASVYGPHMKGNYVRLVRALRSGTFVPLGRGAQRRTLVFDRDAAIAALLAAEHPAAPGRVYNVTDGMLHPFERIVRSICAALERRPPRGFVPALPFRLGWAALDGAGRRLGLRPPALAATVAKLLEDAAVSGARIQRELGFRPTMDLDGGWRAAVAGVRE